MHPSRPNTGIALLALAASLFVACSANPAPSTPIVSASQTPSGALSAAPSGTPSVAPSGAPAPTATPQPSDAPEPTPDPTPTPTPVAGCGTGEAGFTAAGPEAPKTLAFGHATIEFTGAGISMRDGSYFADDAIPAGVGLTADEIAVVVAPGDHIILRAAGLTLLSTTAGAVAWSKVTFDGGLANLPEPLQPLAVRVRSDGSLSISAPTEVGDWAVQFLPQWQGACLTGDGSAYARIKVR